MKKPSSLGLAASTSCSTLMALPTSSSAGNGGGADDGERAVLVDPLAEPGDWVVQVGGSEPASADGNLDLRTAPAGLVGLGEELEEELTGLAAGVLAVDPDERPAFRSL